jgi:hypothetical protein
MILASDGTLVSRPGRSLITAAASVRSGIQFAGATYLHISTSLVRLTPLSAPAVLVTGLSTTPAAWCVHQGILRWTDGVKSGYITADGYPFAELSQALSPIVTTPAGTLPAGRYLISVVRVDANGLQSGCAASTVVTLADGTHSLLVFPGVIPAGCTVRLWCSRANEPLPVLIGDYAASAFPVAITEAPTSSVVLRTVGLYPLPPGNGMTTRGGFLATWSGTLLSFSAGDWTHLHDPTRHFIAFPAAILGAVGVEGGIWVTTEGGIYWIAGADLTKATLSDRIDSRAYAAGGARLPSELTGLKTEFPVAVFASTEGLVYGAANGQLVAPMRESQRWDVAGKRASFAAWEFLGDKFIVVGGI